jgi:hypothetical protein
MYRTRIANSIKNAPIFNKIAADLGATTVKETSKVAAPAELALVA